MAVWGRGIGLVRSGLPALVDQVSAVLGYLLVLENDPLATEANPPGHDEEHFGGCYDLIAATIPISLVIFDGPRSSNSPSDTIPMVILWRGKSKRHSVFGVSF